MAAIVPLSLPVARMMLVIAMLGALEIYAMRRVAAAAR